MTEKEKRGDDVGSLLFEATQGIEANRYRAMVSGELKGITEVYAADLQRALEAILSLITGLPVTTPPPKPGDRTAATTLRWFDWFRYNVVSSRFDFFDSFPLSCIPLDLLPPTLDAAFFGMLTPEERKIILGPQKILLSMYWQLFMQEASMSSAHDLHQEVRSLRYGRMALTKLGQMMSTGDIYRYLSGDEKDELRLLAGMDIDIGHYSNMINIIHRLKLLVPEMIVSLKVLRWMAEFCHSKSTWAHLAQESREYKDKWVGKISGLAEDLRTTLLFMTGQQSPIQLRNQLVDARALGCSRITAENKLFARQLEEHGQIGTGCYGLSTAPMQEVMTALSRVDIDGLSRFSNIGGLLAILSPGGSVTSDDDRREYMQVWTTW